MKSSDEITSISWLNSKSSGILSDRKIAGNNLVKKWVIGAALLIFTSFSVAAQQGRGGQIAPEERAKKATEKMATELELTEEQKSQILALNLEQAKKRQSQMEEEMAERKARAEEMKAHQDKIKTILTEEQRSKWEEIKVEQRKNRRPSGQIHHRGERSRNGKVN